MRMFMFVELIEVCAHAGIAACYAVPALGHSPVAGLYVALAACRLVMLVARSRAVR